MLVAHSCPQLTSKDIKHFVLHQLLLIQQPVFLTKLLTVGSGPDFNSIHFAVTRSCSMATVASFRRMFTTGIVCSVCLTCY